MKPMRCSATEGAPATKLGESYFQTPAGAAAAGQLVRMDFAAARTTVQPQCPSGGNLRRSGGFSDFFRPFRRPAGCAAALARLTVRSLPGLWNNLSRSAPRAIEAGNVGSGWGRRMEENPGWRG